MQTKTITFQNQPVFYHITGEGKPVILLHGFGEDSDVWKYQVDFLKAHFYIIIPDIPGSGLSPVIENADIETYCEIIKTIVATELQKFSQKTITMIGHSMGGYVTLSFAEKYPALLHSFGLFHSTAFADSEEKKQARKKAISFILENGAYAFLRTAIPGLFTQKFINDHSSEVEALTEKATDFSGAALIQYYEAMIARPDRTNALKTFPKPVLFVIGEQDNIIPLQSSLQQCYMPVQSHVHILGNSAHMGMWEEKEKSNSVLFDFLTHNGNG